MRIWRRFWAVVDWAHRAVFLWGLGIGGFVLAALGFIFGSLNRFPALWFAVFVVGVAALVVVALLSAAQFLQERGWLRRSPRTESISTDPTNALSVSLEDEQWSNFRHEARFLKLKVRIRNRTASPIAWDGAQIRDGLAHYNVVSAGGKPNYDLVKERDRIDHEFRNPPTKIPPRGTVEGWWVYVLVYDSEMGEPGYEFLIHSSKGGHEYGFRRIGNPKVPIPIR